MKITLVDLPSDAMSVVSQEIDLKDGATVKDVPATFCAKALAPYCFDGIGTGGQVTGLYEKNLRFEDGKSYMILSSNRRRTEAAMLGK